MLVKFPKDVDLALWWKKPLGQALIGQNAFLGCRADKRLELRGAVQKSFTTENVRQVLQKFALGLSTQRQSYFFVQKASAQYAYSIS